jgi:hypothetical protein
MTQAEHRRLKNRETALAISALVASLGASIGVAQAQTTPPTDPLLKSAPGAATNEKFKTSPGTAQGKLVGGPGATSGQENNSQSKMGKLAGAPSSTAGQEKSSQSKLGKVASMPSSSAGQENNAQSKLGKVVPAIAQEGSSQAKQQKQTATQGKLAPPQAPDATNMKLK